MTISLPIILIEIVIYFQFILPSNTSIGFANVYGNATILKTLLSTFLLSCGLFCTTTPTCRSYNYNKKNGTCILFNELLEIENEIFGWNLYAFESDFLSLYPACINATVIGFAKDTDPEFKGINCVCYGNDSLPFCGTNSGKVRNLARNSNVSMSSRHSAVYGPAMGINGKFQPGREIKPLDLIHTLDENNPWIILELQHISLIYKIRIINRYGYNMRRLNPFTVSYSAETPAILSGIGFETCVSDVDASKIMDVQIFCNNSSTIIAKIVTLQLNRKSIINIQEFELYGFYIE